MYNKVDMICFAVSTCASKAKNLTAELVATPFTPEMKLGPGTSFAIQVSDHMVERLEARFCKSQTTESLEDLNAEITNELRAGHERKLNMQHGLSDYWHRRMLRWNTTECYDLMYSLRVEVTIDTIMLTVSPVMLEDELRECLHNVAFNLASRPDVCFVGAYQQMQPTNSIAAGVVQSGKKESKPFFTAGLDGEGQVVALSDTGIDIDNCYMWDKSQSVSRDKSGQTNMKARKVVQYFAYADSSDVSRGHGSKLLVFATC